MPAVVSRSGTRRRTISEMNMVPFIDVMLVLLIIFMVSAPLITTAVVDLPSVGRGATAPQRVIEVVVGTDEKLRLRVDGKEHGRTTLSQLEQDVRAAVQGLSNVPIVISADRNVRYEAVVHVMSRLRAGGFERVGLLVRQQGS